MPIQNTCISSFFLPSFLPFLPPVKVVVNTTIIKAHSGKDNRVEQEAEKSLVYFWERRVDGGVLAGDAKLRKHAQEAAAV